MPCLKIVKYVSKYVRTYVCMYVCTYAREHAWMKQGKQYNNEVRSRNHPCCGKAINIIYSVCVIQHAKRMRSNVICGPSSSTILFPHYLIQGTIFVNTLLNIKCVF